MEKWVCDLTEIWRVMNSSCGSQRHLALKGEGGSTPFLQRTDASIQAVQLELVTLVTLKKNAVITWKRPHNVICISKK